MNKKILFIACLLYAFLFWLLFPYYKYIFDPDATGYLSVANFIHEGKYFKSINGFWSPLGSWILVPFLKTGIDPLIICKYINGFISLFILFMAYNLMKKIVLNSFIQNAILFSLLILLLYFTFYELFADLLQVFILLLYLNLVCSKNFIRTWWKIALCGIIGGIGYYAKYYTFYFFIVHFPIVAFILLKTKFQKKFYTAFFKKIGIAFISLLIIVVPWWYALSNKYGKFTISNTGKLNSSWQLSSAYNQPRIFIVTPPYPESHSLWEDPSFWPGKYITPFENKTVFIQQIKLTISNGFKLLYILNSFSFLSVITILLGIYFIKKKKLAFSTNPTHSILLSFVLILPIGYLFLVISDRYLWTADIVLLLLAGSLLTVFYNENYFSKRNLLFATLIISFSFLIYPVNQLWDMKNNGKNIYEMANALAKNNIHGKLLCNYQSAEVADKTKILCYLTNSQFYGPGTTDYSYQEILDSIHQYKINYYFFYYTTIYEKEMFKESLLAKNSSRLYDEIYPGLMIAEFK